MPTGNGTVPAPKGRRTVGRLTYDSSPERAKNALQQPRNGRSVPGMEEDGISGEAIAKALGNAFAVAGVVSGCVGLFASGMLATVGTFFSIACLAGVCAATIAAQVESIRARAIESRGWPAPSAEAETPAISQEIDAAPRENPGSHRSKRRGRPAVAASSGRGRKRSSTKQLTHRYDLTMVGA